MGVVVAIYVFILQSVNRKGAHGLHKWPTDK